MTNLFPSIDGKRCKLNTDTERQSSDENDEDNIP